MARPPAPPTRLSPGDRVAVLSLSFAAPALFPAVHEQAMRRLRAEFELEPVEYPTTRRLNADPRDRAADLMAAFADPGIAGLLATIGGDDLLTVLPFLDPELVVAQPKPFAGYSDNTNLLNWLWNLGLASWHGGSTMVHLGRGGGLNPVSAGSLRAALLDGGDLDLTPATAFSEDEQDWADPSALTSFPAEQPGTGWAWHQPTRVVTAPTWGGNLEILHWNLAASRWIRPPEDYAGCILLLETSEERPAAEEVFRMLPASWISARLVSYAPDGAIGRVLAHPMAPSSGLPGGGERDARGGPGPPDGDLGLLPPERLARQELLGWVRS